MTDRHNRLSQAIERLDALHAEDPRIERVEGREVPYELLYAQRMSAWLEKINPEPSEALRLAVRAQHLQRWRLPRDDYPRDRPGYLAWRRELGRRQAEQASAVLSEVGYEPETCERVAAMIRKEELKHNADTQALEDAACLVFLNHYFNDFIEQHRGEEGKLERIVRKTWHKMSPRGHELAATIPLSAEEQAVVQRALQ
ncbi:MULTISPECIES: DUF4202 domain-containing protein [Halomonadaceae]|uniref:DUF4202 domain-containing protein n=1 Tax=Halomonadaceae TaxID=28256 RepID=UPI00159AE4CF|nr:MULTISPECIES: DUF4202 domain-containing protein [unclassified Halomonas]QJQ94117.1 DUF4202 domain-containing protein [Halomonas sp. PA5]